MIKKNSNFSFFTAGRIQQRIALKRTTQNDFKARLKSRFDRFKSRVNHENTNSDLNIGRGSVSQISLDRTNFGRSAFRSSREKSSRERSRSREVVTSQEESEEVEDLIGKKLLSLFYVVKI